MMRARRDSLSLLLTAGALLIAACGSRSSGDSGAPPPSPRFDRPKEALFTDDFSKSGLSDWKVDDEQVWSVRKGMLRAQLPNEKQRKSFARAGDLKWTDYALDVDVCMTRGVDKGAAVRVEEDEGVGVDLRGPGYDDVLLQRGWSRLGRAAVANANGKWHHLRIEARGSSIRVFVNGKRVIDASDDKARASGRIALAAYTGGAGECTVYYDNVAVTRLEGEEKSGS
jgi:hypothetical protein